jgi:hypothetical protein
LPVTVTVYVPPVNELTVRVDVPEFPEVRLTLVGLAEAVSPEGKTEVVTAMLPANPPTLLSVIVEVPDWPAKMMRLIESEEIAKSTTLTVT